MEGIKMDCRCQKQRAWMPRAVAGRWHPVPPHRVQPISPRISFTFSASQKALYSAASVPRSMVSSMMSPSWSKIPPGEQAGCRLRP